jgi:hypothetical protein
MRSSDSQYKMKILFQVDAEKGDKRFITDLESSSQIRAESSTDVFTVGLEITEMYRLNVRSVSKNLYVPSLVCRNRYMEK